MKICGLIKKICETIFCCYRANAHIHLRILGIKIKFRNPLINQLADCCCISDLKSILEKGTSFVHPVGIVIHPETKLGKNCTIYQNVTLGSGKYNPYTQSYFPVIGDNVIIYANAVVAGGVTIGDNAVIGAGSVVINDIPSNAIAAGNPAKVIRTK